MKKLILVASLCIVAAVLAPIASASAEKGSCALEGKATFTPNLKFEPKKEVVYTFTSEGPGNVCVRENGTEAKAEATVTGKGNVGCKEGVSDEPGTGTLKLGSEAAKSFNFTFTANGPIVKFETTGEVKAKGAAPFAGDNEGVKK